MALRTTPADAVAALRSFPRRYREVVAVTEDEDADALWSHAGPAGRTVVEIAVDTVRSLSLLDRALEQVLVTSEPTLHPAVTDRSARTFDVAAHGPLTAILAELDDLAPQCARRVEAAPAGDWARQARVAGTGATMSALQVAAEAVDVGAGNLREARDTMEDARRAH